MSTDIIYQKTPSSEVSKAMLAQAASLFSSSYGIWGPLAEEKMGPFAKQGARVKMTVSRLEQQCLPNGTDSLLVRALANSKLVGHACATRWNFEGRQICWVAQLCVDPGFRMRGVATQMLRELGKDGNDCVFGILSSHPAAVKALLRAFGRGLEDVDLEMVKVHARDIMESSPVEYVKNARLRGSLFGEDQGEGVVSCADTKFFVDHAEPLDALETVKRRGEDWPFGSLPEGCEFLALVESGGVDEAGENGRRLEHSSEFWASA